MKQTNPAIVVIAYNRIAALKRILESLSKADYPSKNIPLIISIDKGTDNKSVLEIAEEFQWYFGKKEVVYQNINLGLRKHVISCASLCNDYGSVILLEDDLFVSPRFYIYACQALNFSKGKEYIAGISLYNHQFNVHAKENFSPIEDGYDNWYFQFASSWGQAWSKRQWNKFYSWYTNQTELSPNYLVPKNVTNWSNKSWLKYFIHYLIETNTYFIYPKIALSSNFSDAGTHIGNNSTIYQVSLDYSKKESYCFSDIAQSNAIYDAFFENEKLFEALEVKKENLCVDLYGSKPIESFKPKYLLSSKIYDFKTIQTFGCELKPRDVNILNSILGSEIFLYNTEIKEKNNSNLNLTRKILYNIKYISRKKAKLLYLRMSYQRIKRIFK